MSNLDTTTLKTVKLMENLEYYPIVSHTDKNVKSSIIITSINDEEEECIDTRTEIIIERNKVKFKINPHNIKCYGAIDFHDGSDDLDIIATFDWLYNLTFCGVWIPANYDYEQHIALSDLKVPRWYDTTRPEVVAQYAHGVIGKPEKCVIFKHCWKK